VYCGVEKSTRLKLVLVVVELDRDVEGKPCVPVCWR
jgi:hypothetical protein